MDVAVKTEAEADISTASAQHRSCIVINMLGRGSGDTVLGMHVCSTLLRGSYHRVLLLTAADLITVKHLCTLMEIPLASSAERNCCADPTQINHEGLHVQGVIGKRMQAPHELKLSLHARLQLMQSWAGSAVVLAPAFEFPVLRLLRLNLGLPWASPSNTTCLSEYDVRVLGSPTCVEVRLGLQREAIGVFFPLLSARNSEGRGSDSGDCDTLLQSLGLAPLPCADSEGLVRGKSSSTILTPFVLTQVAAGGACSSAANLGTVDESTPALDLHEPEFQSMQLRSGRKKMRRDGGGGGGGSERREDCIKRTSAYTVAYFSVQWAREMDCAPDDARALLAAFPDVYTGSEREELQHTLSSFLGVCASRCAAMSLRSLQVLATRDCVEYLRDSGIGAAVHDSLGARACVQWRMTPSWKGPECPPESTSSGELVACSGSRHISHPTDTSLCAVIDVVALPRSLTAAEFQLLLRHSTIPDILVTGDQSCMEAAVLAHMYNKNLWYQVLFHKRPFARALSEALRLPHLAHMRTASGHLDSDSLAHAVPPPQGTIRWITPSVLCDSLARSP